MIFKVLILQALYDLSDDKAEFMIQDRLKETEVIEKLFARFDCHLKDHGLLALGGQIMDASIVEAPHQRNNDGEKEAIKADEVPADWQEKPAKLRQKDSNARWTLKRGRKNDSQSQLMVPAFGYKSHINIDRWTPSSAHGRQRMPSLMTGQDCRSKIRNKVEHVFAHQKGRSRLFIRSIGIDRALFSIGMANIVFNMQCMLWLEKQQLNT